MIKRLIASVVLCAVALLFIACPAFTGDKFDRTIAALNTAPALIDSFSNGTEAERTQLKKYFASGVTALRAYRAAKTDANWSAFLTALADIGTAHISDSRGASRIAAIVGLAKVLLGIPDSAMGGPRGAPRNVPQPNLRAIPEAKVKELERLMKPLP